MPRRSAFFFSFFFPTGACKPSLSAKISERNQERIPSAAPRRADRRGTIRLTAPSHAGYAGTNWNAGRTRYCTAMRNGNTSVVSKLLQFSRYPAQSKNSTMEQAADARRKTSAAALECFAILAISEIPHLERCDHLQDATMCIRYHTSEVRRTFQRLSRTDCTVISAPLLSTTKGYLAHYLRSGQHSDKP